MSIGIVLRSHAFSVTALKSLWDQVKIDHGVLVLSPTSDGDEHFDEDLIEVMGPRLDIVRQQDFGWASALNAGFRRHAARTAVPDLVLCVSPDALPTPSCVQSMTAALRDWSASCAFPSYGRSELSYTVPRNTCCMWPSKLISGLGYFDESLDAGQGMEDYEFALRAFADRGHVPRRVNHVVNLRTRHGHAFEQTTARESIQMRMIDAKYSPETVSQFRGLLQV